MSAQNLAAAAVFEEIADRLAIQGENAFRVRAYSNAARLLQGLGPDVKQKLDGVGFAPNRQSLTDTEARLATDIAAWSKMVTALGLKIK